MRHDRTNHLLNIPALGKAKGLYILVQETLPWMMKFRDKLPYFYITLGYAVVVFIVSYIVSKNKVGYWFQAIREDESAAEAIGVNIVRYKMFAILITAFLLGVGGTIWAQYVTFIDPYLAFHWEIAGLIIILMIAGGSSTVVGPFLGALVLIPVREIIRSELGQSFPGAHMVAYGALLMIILLYLPGGFAKSLRNILDRLRGFYQNRVLPQSHATEAGPSKTIEEVPKTVSQIPITIPSAIKNASKNIQDQTVTSGVTQNGKNHQKILEVRNVTKQFGGLVAVSDLSFSVQRGAILGLVGPNGAGKTTTFNVITGALVSTSGNVFLNNVDISGNMPHKSCDIGLVKTFQNVRPFTNLSVLETTMIGSFLHNPNRQKAEEKAFEALVELGLSDKANDRASSLTLADLKRLEIAKALATEHHVVLLDEAASGLTDVEIEGFWMFSWLSKIRHNITYVIIEHVMKVVMTLCDRIVVMNFGEKIAEGTPSEVSKDPLVLEAYLGTSAEVDSA